jgi:hypothetical protein
MSKVALQIRMHYDGTGGSAMPVVIRFTRREEAKALPILLRDRPGTVLSERTYVLRPETVETLRKAGVQFTEVSRDGIAPGAAGVIAGERI